MAWGKARGSIAAVKHEITIAGGGLAGLSLAVALRIREVPVTVLEAGDYPRHRVCGEFISGVSRETLTALGIADLFEDAHRHRTLAWHGGGRLLHRTSFRDPALGISRYLLDERLRQRVESLGGIVKTGVRALPQPRDGFAWTAGRRPRKSPWLGLKAHVKLPPLTADLEMHAGTNGYAGLAGVEDGWTNVCGLFRTDRSLPATSRELLPAYLAAGGQAALADLVRRSEWRVNSFSAVAGFQLGRQPPVPGLLTLGDAESMIPPFTGNGMSMAFQAAECATEPLTAWSHGELAWQAAVEGIQTAVRRRFRRRLTTARILHQRVLDPNSQSLIHILSTARLLPFQPLLALIR
jgi:menaquinone-9 beta-reductase